MQNNPDFPRPLLLEEADLEDTEEAYADTLRVPETAPQVEVLIGDLPFRAIPPPYNAIMDDQDGGNNFVIQRRQLSYLGKVCVRGSEL
jgi:hypothetical protein